MFRNLIIKIDSMYKTLVTTGPYDKGGVHTNNKKDGATEKQSDVNTKKISHFKDVHCIYPGDLYPFTRKPLFLIVDSPNSGAFQVIY